MARYLTIDVGGTAIKYALMDEEAVIYSQGEVPTPLDSLESYIDALGSIYDQYAAENEIEAVCMSAPGRVDADNGYFYTGGSLNFIHEIDLADVLKDRIPVPFCAENDAKAAALAELWKGSMKDVKNGIVITLGTGIGGSVIIDGKLHRGSNYSAGEFSFIPMDWNSRFYGDKMWYTSNGVPYLMEKYAASTNQDKNDVNGRIFFAKVNEGDPAALEELGWYLETFVTALYALQLVLDVDKVAIGGGISRQPILIEKMNEAADKLYNRMPAFSPAIKPEITACEFASDANLVGALYHYLHEVKPRQEEQA